MPEPPSSILLTCLLTLSLVALTDDAEPSANSLSFDALSSDALDIGPPSFDTLGFNKLKIQPLLELCSLQGNIQHTVINNQHVYIADNKEAGSIQVAEWMLEQLNKNNRNNKQTVFGLATGSTPLPVYQKLAQLHTQNRLQAHHLITFNLDEYLGLDSNHPASYFQFMNQHLFQFLNIPSDQIHIPAGTTDDPEAEVLLYQQALNNHPRDIQLLGLGHNGHIAFNEPGSAVDSRTRIIDLSESTRRSNSRFFETLEQVPSQAITMGMADIMESQLNIVMAWGETKADAVYRAITGEITADFPASFLQQHHQTVWVIDQEAGRKILLFLDGLPATD